VRFRREPHAGLALLIFKLKNGGLSWLSDRIRREWEMPTTAWGRVIYRTMRAIVARNRRPLAKPATTLHAFYDLGVAPITFDVLWFLVGAEIQRQRLGLPDIRLVIVPGPDGGLRRERDDYEMVSDADARRLRIRDLLVPAASLLPTISAVTITESRGEAAGLCIGAGTSVFPSGYEPAIPVYSGAPFCLAAVKYFGQSVASLRASASHLSEIDRWLVMQGGRGRIVVITLRAYGYMPARNSNLAAWIGIANQLRDEGYWPVFVPDTDQIRDGRLPQELAGFPIAANAALDVRLRMALYERAWLNLGVNGGPMGLCWLNERTRYITFKIITRDVPQTTPEYVASHGFVLGRSLPFATSFQKWVWANDDLAVIESEFSHMAALIKTYEAGQKAPLHAVRYQ